MAVPVTGYTELDLVGFTDKGTYNAATTYVANDLVSYNGIKWKCLQDGTVGVTPAEGVSWSVFIVDNEINDNAVSATSTWSSQKINTTKADQTAIAPVENGTTASRAYAIGEHFMKDGAFCTAIAAIAQGATFTLDTNYTAGTVGARVAEIEEEIRVGWTDCSSKFTLETSYTGSFDAYEKDGLVVLQGVITTPSVWYGGLLRINDENYYPKFLMRGNGFYESDALRKLIGLSLSNSHQIYFTADTKTNAVRTLYISIIYIKNNA